jgi:hypothetical protein
MLSAVKQPRAARRRAGHRGWRRLAESASISIRQAARAWNAAAAGSALGPRAPFTARHRHARRRVFVRTDPDERHAPRSRRALTALDMPAAATGRGDADAVDGSIRRRASGLPVMKAG